MVIFVESLDQWCWKVDRSRINIAVEEAVSPDEAQAQLYFGQGSQNPSGDDYTSCRGTLKATMVNSTESGSRARKGSGITYVSIRRM